jgi:toxin-antitoxin system, toxin component, Txe/YoeB family
VYKVVYTKRSVSDIEKLKSSKLDKKAKQLIELMKVNPYQMPPRFEKLQGDLLGAYSRRINIKHRLVYEVFEVEKTIKVISMWSHYEF